LKDHCNDLFNGGNKRMKLQEQKLATPSIAKKRSGERPPSGNRLYERSNVARARKQVTKLVRQIQADELSGEQQGQGTGSISNQPMSNQDRTLLARAMECYLDDHRGGNHSRKTLEWHETALGLLLEYLEHELGITLVTDVGAADISNWFSHLRTTPGGRGKLRGERTVQTYARSARAFFHWLVRQGLLTENPFDLVAFPKVGKPLIQTITDEEFEKLLLACALPHADGQHAERATARNRAILWLLYDTGIRVSELTGLRLGDLDRKHGLITVKGKGSKQRRIALGQNCLRSLLHYLDHHRPDEQELAAWGYPGEDHVLLSETRGPLTKNGMTLLFARLKKRAGITGKRVSPGKYPTK
jgi:site-specific recombinase XerD